VLDDDRIRVQTGMGRVDQIFQPHAVEDLLGIAAIGHTRYSTTGSSSIQNAQPFLVEANDEMLAIGHNGNIVNPLELRRLVRERGVEPTTGSDSELLRPAGAPRAGDLGRAYPTHDGVGLRRLLARHSHS
jgi:amidophosphoribosyltransferase